MEPMLEKFLRVLRAMELEEKILHIGVVIGIFGLFIPWLGGQWYGNTQQWSGFGFHTGFIGHAVFFIELFILASGVSPLVGGPVLVRKSKRAAVRLQLTSICTILLIAAFTILLRLTSEASGAEIRFGIYIAIVGSALATLYAFLEYQEELKRQAQALFHHPDEQAPKPKPQPEPFPEDRPPPPPPPPPMPVEEHHLFSKP